jgi:glucose-1-phosphate cytidylyltransferase
MFALTYGNGVADLDLAPEIAFEATVTAVRPARRFGAIAIEGDRGSAFKEKPMMTAVGSMAAFFCYRHLLASLLPEVNQSGKKSRWQRSWVTIAFSHHGFWHPMDIICDKRFLEEKWASGRGEVGSLVIDPAFWLGRRVLLTDLY